MADPFPIMARIPELSFADIGWEKIRAVQGVFKGKGEFWLFAGCIHSIIDTLFLLQSNTYVYQVLALEANYD